MEHRIIAACVAVAASLTIALASLAPAQELPRATTPEDVGLSSERLKRLSAVLKEGVDKGEIPGAVVVIGRNDRIAYLESFGFRDRKARALMTVDAIFDIGSMTKVFTSLAVMILAEEGKLRIADPVLLYVPEFKDLKVGVERKDANGETTLMLERARREMTVQDLLRHTSGLTGGTAPATSKSMVNELYDQVRPGSARTNAEMVTKLAKLPLRHHPGTTWEYGMSTNVLAHIVEIVSGMAFDDFFAQRIARPLKLADTGFWVDPTRHARLAQPQSDKEVQPSRPDVKSRPNRISGGGGMVSTPLDYARFCQFLLNGGHLDGVRLVSRKTIEFMTADHLVPGTPVSDPLRWGPLAPSPEMGQGFGLGFLVRNAAGRTPLPGSIGEFSWAGAAGTYFWIDPKERMYVVFMMHAPAQRRHYFYLMRQLVYQAVVD
jgi:CubicO group peptidase (beta-lactamase class C family)